MVQEKKTAKPVATNRKALRDYQIFDRYEAGIVLRGDEVKSLRNASCSIEEGFARVEDEEVLLYNMYIPEFGKASHFRSEPRRKRVLLLHKKEISKLIGLTAQRGYTLIPLKIYFNDKGLAKLQLGLAKGRQQYDKRRKLRDKFEEREVQQQMKRYK